LTLVLSNDEDLASVSVSLQVHTQRTNTQKRLFRMNGR